MQQYNIINVNLKLPTKWEDLTDKQLRYLFGLLANGRGRETPRFNSGDISRVKKHKRHKCFSRKYYAPVMRIKEFYEDNIGETFSDIIMAVGHDYGR